MSPSDLLGLKDGTKVYTDDALGIEGTVTTSDDDWLVIRWEDHKMAKVDKHNQIILDFIARSIRLTPEAERKGGRLTPRRKGRK